MIFKASQMDYLRFRLVGSLFEPFAQAARRMSVARTIFNSPELAECLTEDRTIDRVLERVIRNGMNCVDVGAHLGSMMNRFVRLSPGGQHVAFEPLEYKAKWLRDRYPAHAVHTLAASDRAGEVEFYYQPQSSGYSGLRLHDAGVNNTRSVRIKVGARRLDDVLEGGRPIGFLKVDVEGAEVEVFNGAADLILRDRPIILFECTRSALLAFERVPGEVFDLLRGRFDYQVRTPNDFLADIEPLSRVEFERATRYPFRAFNFLATPT